jgi:hypothetical protein
VVLQALQEWSGVLRGTNAHLVEFTHNRLRSYFAAWQYADEGEPLIQETINKAIASDDLDLAVLAAWQGNEPYRVAMVRGLLDRASSDAKHSRALKIAAVRCRTMKPLRHEELNRELTQLEGKLLPPRNRYEAAQLAELGERVVPSLARKKRRATEIDAACVRTLRLIGGPAAMEVLETYLTHEAEEVVEELAQAENPLRSVAIRRFVESGEFWKYYAPLRHLKVHDLEALPSTATYLNLRGTSLASLMSFERFTLLQRLSLRGTQVADLAPIAGLTGLQQLDLSFTQVVDLAPLAGLTGLQQLDLSSTQVADLAPLAGLTRLEIVALANTPVTDAAIASLRQQLALRGKLRAIGKQSFSVLQQELRRPSSRQEPGPELPNPSAHPGEAGLPA